MINSSFRILAAFVLVVTLLALSGVTSTAAALMQPEEVSSCCESDCDDTPVKSGPCSTLDCPCFSCMNVTMASPFTLERRCADGVLIDAARSLSHPIGYSPSIDYPPEAG